MERPFSHSLPRTQVPQLSRQNHYVPKWYQKRFILGSRGTLHRLDLDASARHLPDGRKVAGRDVQLRSPKRCFVQQDLYTTRIGRMINDEVERFLFGPIDACGALAVRAFASDDFQAIHNHFQSFFEYLDAQKLRTPKGLDWIDIRYPNLTQMDLMVGNAAPPKHALHDVGRVRTGDRLCREVRREVHRDRPSCHRLQCRLPARFSNVPVPGRSHRSRSTGHRRFSHSTPTTASF